VSERVLGLGLALIALVALAAPRLAVAEDDDLDDEGVALVNAASPDVLKASERQLLRLRKRLDALGALHPTPPEVAAALDGSTAADLAPIKDAFARFDYDGAEELLEQAINDLLNAGDPERIASPLAGLLHWRGMIADELDDPADAETWFAAAYRLDPERPIDRETTPPRVRRVIQKARTAERPDGRIQIELIDVDEDAARIAVDGGPGTRLGGPLGVAAGYHLVVVTAPRRSAFAKLVRVGANRTVELEVELAPESDVSRARRARDAVVAARSDKARLKKARPLARITGARKLLVIEGEDELTVRVFDLDARTVSSPMSLRQASRTAVLAELLGVEQGFRERDRDRAWYERWYVWVGVAALAGGGYATWELTHREPTSIRGF
jgi:tetratricopeptide (TPR) repeat protein